MSKSSQLQEEGSSTSVSSFGFPVHSKGCISSLVGTGNIIWSGTYVIVSTIGLVLSVGLLELCYINPFGITYWWYKGILFVVCMVASPIIFGGIVIGLWHLWERKTSAKELDEDDGPKIGIMQDNGTRAQKKSSEEHAATSNSVRYGGRPEFKGISRTCVLFWLLLTLL